MTSRSFQELMTDALDGRLSSEDAVRFQALLAESEERRRDWSAFQEMREKLLSVGMERPPRGLTERIREAVRGDGAVGPRAAGPGPEGPAAPRAPRSWSHLAQLGWVRAAATIVLLGLVTAIVLEERQARTPPVSTGTEAEAAGDGKLAEEDQPGAEADAFQARKSAGEADRGEKDLVPGAAAPSEDGALRRGEDPGRRGPANEKRALPAKADRPSPGDRLTPPEEEAEEEARRFRQGQEGYADRDLKGMLDAEGNARPADGLTGFYKRLDRMEEHLKRIERARPPAGGGAVTLDEAMIHLGRSIEDFSKQDLESRGVQALAEAMDRRVLGGRFAETSGADGAPVPSPRSFGSGQDDEKKERQRGAPSADPRSKKLPEDAPAPGGARPPSAGGGGAGAAGAGQRTRSRPAKPTPPRSKPRGRGRGGRGRTGAGRAPTPLKPVDGDPRANEGGRAQAAPSRHFLTVIGEDAGARVRRMLRRWPGSRELPVEDAFGKGPGPAGRDEGSGKPGGAKAAKAEDKRSEGRPAAGYAIFELTVPGKTADRLIARLESQPGLSLRVIGKSRLVPAPAARDEDAGGAKGRRGRPARKTLVVIVLDR